MCFCAVVAKGDVRMESLWGALGGCATESTDHVHTGAWPGNLGSIRTNSLINCVKETCNEEFMI